MVYVNHGLEEYFMAQGGEGWVILFGQMCESRELNQILFGLIPVSVPGDQIRVGRIVICDTKSQISLVKSLSQAPKAKLYSLIFTFSGVYLLFWR